jgi:hypothetical protein
MDASIIINNALIDVFWRVVERRNNTDVSYYLVLASKSPNTMHAVGTGWDYTESAAVLKFSVSTMLVSPLANCASFFTKRDLRSAPHAPDGWCDTR